MKNNSNDNEKFLKNLIERKSREQLIDNYKSIKSSSAAYNLALPVLIILAAIFLPLTIDDRWPIFLIAAVVAITFTTDLVATNKKMDILFALELEREQASSQNTDQKLLQQLLKQQETDEAK